MAAAAIPAAARENRAPSKSPLHARLRELIEGRLAQGAHLVQLEIKPAIPPWARFAGTWSPDDPVIDEWLESVDEYRRHKDADPDFP